MFSDSNSSNTKQNLSFYLPLEIVRRGCEEQSHAQGGQEEAEEWLTAAKASVRCQ